MKRETTHREPKKSCFAAHHYVLYLEKDGDEIARIVRVKRKKLDAWMTSSAWVDALRFVEIHSKTVTFAVIETHLGR